MVLYYVLRHDFLAFDFDDLAAEVLEALEGLGSGLGGDNDLDTFGEGTMEIRMVEEEWLRGKPEGDVGFFVSVSVDEHVD